MVVTRRVPVPPVPPTSRTPSTQNPPLSRNRSQLSQRAGDNKLSLENKKALPTAPSEDTNTYTSKNRHSSSIFSCLLLTLFSLYVVAIFHPSPVESFRSALSVPNDNLVKPYIVPPLQAALLHPTIEPHVTKIQTTLRPYAQCAESGVRPVLAVVSKIEGNYVRPLVRRGTIVSYVFIRKTWQQLVIPSYNSYLRPHVQPHINRWEFFYSREIEPRLRIFIAKCMIYHNKIQSGVDKAQRGARHYSDTVRSEVAPRVRHFYKTVRPHVVALYIKGRPYIIVGWRFFRIQAMKGVSVLRTYATTVAVRLDEARHEFVDPHIKRIWEKVESRAATTRDTSFSSMSSAERERATWDTNIGSMVTATPDVSLTSETLASVPLPELSEPTPESHIDGTETVTKDTTLEAAASIISESMGIGVAAEMVPSKEVDSGVSEDVPSATVSVHVEMPVSETPEVAPTMSQEALAPTNAPAIPVSEDEEVDDFLMQLGILSNDQPDAQQPVSVSEDEPLTEHAFSAKQDEDTAETLTVKIAAKRAAIVNRHNDWQAQLDRLFVVRERDLRKSLVAIRKKAVEELKTLRLNGGQEDKGEKVVETVEQEASRLVKGVEGYLKNERSRKDKLKYDWYEQLDDKKRQWEMVLDKVNEKFAEKVGSVQEEVHKWYLGIRAKEADEVLKAAAELKSLAEQAQTDLGMDYAYLEDVTYNDWQRYHDLMRLAQRFDITARTVQNGTHAHPPVDPVVPALDVLEKEVEEVISGFRVRFSMLLSEGTSLYAKLEPETPNSAVSPTTSDEPTMSILPIGPDSRNPLMMDPSSIILEKSKEQIKQAVNMAGFNVDDENEARADNHVEL